MLVWNGMLSQGSYVKSALVINGGQMWQGAVHIWAFEHLLSSFPVNVFIFFL